MSGFSSLAKAEAARASFPQQSRLIRYPYLILPCSMYYIVNIPYMCSFHELIRGAFDYFNRAVGTRLCVLLNCQLNALYAVYYCFVNTNHYF